MHRINVNFPICKNSKTSFKNLLQFNRMWRMNSFDIICETFLYRVAEIAIEVSMLTCSCDDLHICGHVSISTSRLWNRKLNLSRLHNSETDLNSVQFLDTQLVGAKLFISKQSTREMLVRWFSTHLSLSFYIALIWVESSQSRRKRF